ncbi:uncharacterized protein RJT20DRAFT_125301 [Scheffersomyces xylosifermentans]|uniref:uncharacterized protein n=1 Tax=Scheffersomyces xylosifermentans TaxID=1304137 RepID=UPI00315D3F1F
MFSSTSPSLIHTNRFDMLDPTSDANQYNEFPLIANSASYLLDEASTFDDSYINSSSPHGNNHLSAAPINAGASSSSSGVPMHNSNAANVNLAGSNFSNFGMNAGHSYLNYGGSLPMQQSNAMLSQQNTSSSLYSFNNSGNNQMLANNKMFTNAGMEYDLLTTSNTPTKGHFIPNSSSNNSANHELLTSSSMNSFFDGSSMAYNSQKAGNYYSSPQPFSQLSVSDSLISSNFDLQHQHPLQHQQQHHLPPQPPSASSSTFDSLSYSPHSTSTQPIPEYYSQQTHQQHISPAMNHNASAPAILSAASQIKHASPIHHHSLGDELPMKKRYRVIRGVSAGGSTTRPPKQSIDSESMFLPVELNLVGATVDDICYPQWSKSEKEDRRRIIRIERIQNGPQLIANFSIVGSANENPTTLPPPPNVDVVEVSCLECNVKVNDEYYDSQSSDDEGNKIGGSPKNLIKSEVDGETYQYYITSVEVVEIVELLIGTQLKDPAEKRRERGRVRSNLVPFWSKKPISSRMNDSGLSSNSISPIHQHSDQQQPTNQDFRVELAKRIMGYEIRKPRGFDKEVRILRWDKLVPALKRALQSYYTEIPQSDAHLEF